MVDAVDRLKIFLNTEKQRNRGVFALRSRQVYSAWKHAAVSSMKSVCPATITDEETSLICHFERTDCVKTLFCHFSSAAADEKSLFGRKSRFLLAECIRRGGLRRNDTEIGLLTQSGSEKSLRVTIMKRTWNSSFSNSSSECEHNGFPRWDREQFPQLLCFSVFKNFQRMEIAYA
jgi:hypothetical protein